MNNRRSMNDFCKDIIRLLTEHGIEFLVGGYDAFRDHTGISRETKDFDLITRPGKKPISWKENDMMERTSPIFS